MRNTNGDTEHNDENVTQTEKVRIGTTRKDVEMNVEDDEPERTGIIIINHCIISNVTN